MGVRTTLLEMTTAIKLLPTAQGKTEVLLIHASCMNCVWRFRIGWD